MPRAMPHAWHMSSSWWTAAIRHEYILQTGGNARLLFAACPLTQWKSESVSYSLMSSSLRPHRAYPTRILCPWNSAGKNFGVGSHSLLQGIFPTQGSNLGLLHCNRILYHLSHLGSLINSMDHVPISFSPRHQF